MTYSPNIGNSTRFLSRTRNNSNFSTDKIYARVEYVVTDSTSLFYNDFGKVDSINGIKFRILGEPQENNNIDVLPFAYPGNTPSFTSCPLIDEIVEIQYSPSKSNPTTDPPIPYYFRILNIWNNNNHNAYPDEKFSGTNARLGENIIEKENIRPLQPFPGDVYIQGRNGQSLRFSGFNSTLSPFTDDINNGDPITILRNGQPDQEDVESTNVENVNEDDSSIYLTSNHIIPVNLATKKQQSYKTQEDLPTKPQVHRGRQVVIDSGRVVLNSKDNDILISSLLSTSISSKNIHLDASSYIGIDGPSIYLGTNSFSETQPAVLGGENNLLLSRLFKSINNLAQVLSALPPSAASIASLLNDSGESLFKEVEELEKQLPNLLSDKIFVE